MASIIVRSTRVVLPSGVHPAEIVIDGERIAAVRPLDPAAPRSAIHPTPPGRDRRPAAIGPQTHDVGELVVMPGIVDTHVHVNEPGRTEWEGFASAGAAAAAGGVTTIVDMPLNSVPPTTTAAGLRAKRAAADAARVDVAFWGGVVPDNADELDALAAAGVRGFKCFLSPSGVDEFPAVDERHLRRALPVLVRHDLPLLVHAESPPALLPIPDAADRRAYATWLASRPPRAEVDAIAMLIDLCRTYRARIHVVHLATPAALPLIRAARSEGLALTVETCPHYLTFAAEDVPDGATLFKCAPPIRGRETREALWRGLAEGDIDFVASDHSPCPPALKADGDFVAAWGGIASLELALSAVWTGARERRIGLERLADWLCAGPARLAGLADRKGTLAPAKDADLVIWSPETAFTVDPARLRQRHKRTPYAGLTLHGQVRATYVRGRLVYGDSGG